MRYTGQWVAIILFSLILPFKLSPAVMAGEGNEPDPEEGLRANFTYSHKGMQFSFLDTSMCEECTITDWFWEFGDGNTSRDQHPEHTYAKAASYNVTLTVFTEDLSNHITKPMLIALGSVLPSNTHTTYKLRVIVGSQMGSEVILDPPGGVYKPGTQVTLTAIPIIEKFSREYFYYWSDDLSGYENPETIFMDGNKKVTAYFKTLVIDPDLNSDCDGYCGEKGRSGCWCDDICEHYDDCCPDKVKYCAK